MKQGPGIRGQGSALARPAEDKQLGALALPLKWAFFAGLLVQLVDASAYKLPEQRVTGYY